MSDHDLLPVAPHRALPDDVRERMRDRIAFERRKPPARRGPLAVAAAVVLLAAGGVVVAQSARNDAVPAAGWSTVPADHVSTEPTTAEDLRRCGVDWEPDYTIVMRGRRVVVGQVDDFCELTYASVRTSRKRDIVVIGEGVVLWQTPDGLTVGKAPKGTTSMEFVESGQTTMRDALSGSPAFTALLPDRRFVVRSTRTVDEVLFDFDGWQPKVMRLVKADLPADEWSTTRWAFPSGTADPEAPENRMAACLDYWLTGGMGFGLPEPSDPTGWRPVVRAGDPSGVQVIRDDERTAYCEFRDGRLADVRVGRDSKLGRSAGPLDVQYRSGVPADGRLLLAGSVRNGVGKLVFTAPGGAPTEVALADGWFAVSLATGRVDDVLALEDVAVRAETVDGKLLYTGRLVG
ncbi:hypothetical protein [Umezawaea sp. Da 62-37]|uniref:hypothetical protein n=1 Tax=Umezawaea sp. Da 62-37 TaxID=3075927 RepID=UPI0028F6E5A6|nr:hypothetical protein [Umezawaea sp. Da 62-37]WNV84209.1 hypothetical protein RM788_39530 [Umezawaea sp. Da 62-37]